jgi:hypothetical protein
MLEELIENYFAKQVELAENEEKAKAAKQMVKDTQKNLTDILRSLSVLMEESGHDQFLYQKDGKNLLVSLGNDSYVSICEIPTAREVKTELAIDRMKKGTGQILEDEKAKSKPRQKKNPKNLGVLFKLNSPYHLSLSNNQQTAMVKMLNQLSDSEKQSKI